MITRHLTASGLMIGDWVSYDGKCYQIAEIGGIVCLGAEKKIFTTLEDITPIHITPEILAKNGFGYVEHDEIADVRISHYYLGEPHFCKNMDLHIGTDNRGHFWINDDRNTICGLRDVHELQHALKLCGIEKEIVL